MRTFFWLVGDGFPKEEAALIYDFDAVEDVMLVILHDEEAGGPIAVIVYERGYRNWEIDGDKIVPEKVDAIIEFLQQYFADKDYRFRKAVHYFL
ncbi:MAG: hypothetical protein DI535_04880 [Citrobacter freundii]|nr:MAG: hypothetical protein DI535_04880 [Citrobacter freundii]